MNEKTKELPIRVGCDRGLCHQAVGRQDRQLNTYDWLADVPGNAEDTDLVEVQFKHTRKGYYHNVNNLPLKKGEKILFAAVSDHYEDSINTDAEYTLAVYSAASGYELRSGDSVYLILNGFAYLDQYTGGNTGIRLPETVYDPEQDTDIPVIGYTPELLTALGPACTFYCEPDSESYAYMQEHGICFAVPEPQTGIRGDITGDGAVNVNDWLTLMRWLNECPGMLMHDPAYAAADLNEDGCLDLFDANALMELAAADTPL